MNQSLKVLNSAVVLTRLDLFLLCLYAIVTGLAVGAFVMTMMWSFA